MFKSKLNVHAVLVLIYLFIVFFLLCVCFQKVAGIVIGKSDVKSFPDRKSLYIVIQLHFNCCFQSAFNSNSPQCIVRQPPLVEVLQIAFSKH